MKDKNKRSLLALTAGLAGLIVWSCSSDPPGRGPVRFSEQPVEIKGYYLFDAGIVDADGDGNLDIFTSNHTALPSLLLGDGHGKFRDVYAEWGLSQQPEFPGLENTWIEPELEGEGISIYWYRRRLIIKPSPAARPFDISGRLSMDSSMAIVDSSGWECALKRESLSPNRTRTELDFNLARERPEGKLVLEPELPEAPQTFTFEKRIPLSSIFIGAGSAHPQEHSFRLALRDRHGLAWADWNEDGRPEVFMASGGVSGRIADFPEIRQYELFMKRGAGLMDVAPELNLTGNGGRPRQTAWLDVDGDNLLELFVYGIWSGNQLFKQAPGGGFIDVTGESGLRSTKNGLSAWFDADGDVDPDLLVAARDEFVLYLNDQGLFREVRLGPNPHAVAGAPAEHRQFGRPAFSDFDGDGDIDIYVASAAGSTLILNLGGVFRLEEPEAFGLPSRAVSAAWVDADNDSLPDLYSVPDGLFLQARKQRFRRTGILAGRPDEAAAARCLWFDADNDGDRDVLISILPRDDEVERLWSSRFLLNKGSGRHWLEVQVVGPPGNRDAVGAGVVVELSDGRRLKDYVGLSDGSYYSQGHYRLYFGLGKAGSPKSVSVLWPDGLTEKYEVPAADRLMICGRGLSRRDPGGREADLLR
jgi:hypothetical protein